MSIALALLFAALGAALALGASAMFDLVSARSAIAVSAPKSRGIILGAARKYPFDKPELVALPSGHALILGESAHSDDALLAAASAWNGALVFIDGRGLSSNLQRSGIIRLAPARPGSARYNPLQAIGAGPRAWSEALELARGLLGPEAEARAPSFAALILDHLLTAPIENRHLAALRARLANPKRLLSELVSHWTHDFAGDRTPHAELARIAASLAANPMKAAADFEHVDRALRFLADGRFAASCATHDFNLSDLICGDGPASLVIETPPDASRFGLNALTQSQTIPRALALKDFDAIGVFGPQSNDNAGALSASAGVRRTWRMGNPFVPDATWKSVLCGAMMETRILKPRRLEKLKSHEAHIQIGGTRRRARSVTLTPRVEAHSIIVPCEALQAPVHNWTAPPTERSPAALRAEPLPASAAPPAISASTKIRKALRAKPAHAIAASPASETKLL